MARKSPPLKLFSMLSVAWFDLHAGLESENNSQMSCKAPSGLHFIGKESEDHGDEEQRDREDHFDENRFSAL